MPKKSIESNIKWSDRKHRAWFPFSFTVYKLSDERLYIQTGFLKTHYDETLLYRIVDLCLERSLAQKLFGTGTIVLDTQADTQGSIRLQNIRHPLAVKEMFSDIIEKARTQRGVIGREFYGHNHHPSEHNDDHTDDAPNEAPGYDFHNDH